jgi:hypothetical protein
MAHYALITPDGDPLGPVEVTEPNSAVGSLIKRGGRGLEWRVVECIPSDDPELFSILVVEPE